MTSAPREHDVFISYASEDKETADLVCAALEQAGIPCWIAPRDTQAGAYGRSIMAAIRSARMLVLVLSPDADRSPNVLTEVAEAFDRKIPLLPFRLSNFVVSDELRFYIRTQHWIDAFPDPPQGHVRQLVKQVRTRMAARVRAPSREPDRSPEAPQDAPPPRPPARARPARARRWTVPLIVGGAAFVVIGIAVAVALLQPGPTPGPPARAADGPGISPAPPPVPPLRPTGTRMPQAAASAIAGALWAPGRTAPNRWP